MSETPPGHKVVLFEENPQSGRWRYVCRCRSRGPWRSTPSEAADDLAQHYQAP